MADTYPKDSYARKPVEDTELAEISDEEFLRFAELCGRNSGKSRLCKAGELLQVAEHREELLKTHELRSLFLELTDVCNERCRHCGSRCDSGTSGNALTLPDYRRIIDELAEDFDTSQVHLCITGGEPLLRPDFFPIMEYAKTCGFRWGMTSNGTLITPEVAERLYAAGMQTISVSIDGLRESHEWFRQTRGSFDAAIRGVRALVNVADGKHVQVTTCVNRRNLAELDEMYDLVASLGVTSWRVINVEPIGRALEEPDLLLTPEEFAEMIDYIERRRFEGPMEVCYGCSHYLGVDLERETRGWYYLCTAGTTTASIASNGDILACLDIERRPELVQGNVRDSRFREVWDNRFEVFRGDFRKCGKCADCFDYPFCAGDSFHTWNFDTMEPRMCMEGVLF